MSEALQRIDVRAAAPGLSELLATPTVRLFGEVNDEMLKVFLDGVVAAESGPVVVELTTTGGDADIGRRIASDIKLLREGGQRTAFLGKAVVYSAGVSIMGAFAREDRWLAPGTMLLIHERSLRKNLRLDGPLSVERSRVEMALAEIDSGMRMQESGFKDLILGSQIDIDELRSRARLNWYLDAEEALARQLIAGVF